MVTFSNGESGLSVRTKLNEIINKVEGVTSINNDIDITGTLTSDGLTVDGDVQLGIENVTNGVINVPESMFINFDSNNDDTTEKFIIASNGTGSSGTKHLQVEENGDISFYEDTGTTAKFFWDASAESLGIGTSSPQYTVNISNTDTSTGLTANPLLVLTNTEYTAGTGATLGFGFTSNSIGAAITGRSAASSAGGYLTFETRDTVGTIGERMRIDSSGRVGIGTATVSDALHIAAIDPAIRFEDTSSGITGYSRIFTDNNNAMTFDIDAGNNRGLSAAIFKVDGSEAMRIDSSGNLLVGKTADNLTDAGQVFTTAGSSFTRSGGAACQFNRNTSDGEIVRLSKDGATVGSIETANGDLTIYSSAASHGGVRFAQSGLLPIDNSGTLSDATRDIGQSDYRWKDLFLSGGVYLGGTVAANLLDDYEEGTWDPEIYATGTDFSSVTYDNRTGGTYTKIGRVVHIQMTIVSDAITVGSASGDVAISGLPFAASSGTGGGTDQGYAALSVAYASNWASNPPQAARIIEGSSAIGLYTGIATTATVVVADAGTGANDNYVNITGTYITDS